MGTKRLLSINIFGGLKILFGITAWIPIIIRIAVAYIGYPGPSTPPPFLNYLFLAIGLFFLVYIVGAIGILRLKNWGRKLSIIMDALVVLIYFRIGITQRAYESLIDCLSGGHPYFDRFLLILIVPLVLLPFIFVYYFIRPQVKEQFK